MASQFTRSRRTEGLSTRSSNAIILRTNSTRTQATAANIKRPRDESDDDIKEGVKKKAKIAIEIQARKVKAKPKTRSLLVKEESHTSSVAGEKYAAAATRAKHTISTSTTTQAKIEERKLLQPQSKTVDKVDKKKATNHHDKVVNGIKHELDRLQPIAADVKDGLKDEKRKLRSQEGTRFKSELSAYFPDYDEVIGNDPKEEHILNFDTPLSWPKPRKAALRKPDDLDERFALKDDPDSLFTDTDMEGCHRIDTSVLSGGEDEEDTMTDEYFERIHRKPERQEKSIRNTDKGRAQHEKDQVIRLLEGLQGHDWLKLMGVSGITESKKKEYEPAREHFIRGCEAIIEKFKMWKDEEKRRKLEKEALRAATEEAEDEEEEEEDAEPEEDQEIEEDEGDISDGDPPDYSDVDASAARQLHEEAIARSAPATKNPGRGRPRAAPVPPPVQQVEKPFTSFFSKPHLRDAAMGKYRRSGRTVAAWGFGQPVPDVQDQDFDLPEEYRDEETLKIHARRKRRDRRVTKT